MTKKLCISHLILFSFLIISCGDNSTDYPSHYNPNKSKADNNQTSQSENIYSSETQLANTLDNVILPYFDIRGESGWFQGINKVWINYSIYRVKEAKGSIVLINGRTESMAKYAETIFDLNQQGYSVYLLDHRGQGFSDRMLENPNKGYVKDFFNYVFDLDTFINEHVLVDNPKHLWALSHSMGGAILALYLLEYPNVFESVIFLSPMFQINFGATGENLTYKIAKAAPSKTASWASVKSLLAKKFEKNKITSSRARFEMIQNIVREYPETDMGHPTFGWVEQSILAGRHLRRRAGELHLPMLVIQGGYDKVISIDASKQVCEHASGCQYSVFETARHNLLMETDAIRNNTLDIIVSFFQP